MKKRFLLCLVILATLVTFVIGASAATEITTAAQIKTLMDATDAATMGGDYVLMNDIDMSGVTGQSPIGEVTTAPFTGTFDGKGYTISGLNIEISRTDTRGAGLFGHLKGGTVQNLSVDGSISVTNASATDFGIGGIAGFITPAANGTTKILNCANYCTITTVDGESRAGGIAGAYITRYGNTNYAGTKVEIKNCVNYGSVTGKKHLAGIIGRVDYRNGTGSPGGTLTVSGCANYATITPDASTLKSDSYGGIIGTLLLRDGGSIRVLNCINTGAVRGGFAVGGIIGRANLYASTTKAELLVEYCVNLGDVSTTATTAIECTAVGGIVGQSAVQGSGTLTMDITVNHCYNAGKVSTIKNTSNQTIDGAIIGQTNGDGSGSGKVEMRYETTNDTDVNGTPIQNWRSPDYKGSSPLNATQDGTSISVEDLAAHSLFDMSAFVVKQGALAWNVPFTNTELAFLHNCAASASYVVQSGKLCCALCGAEVLTAQVIDGEPWLQLSSAEDIELLMTASRSGSADLLDCNFIMTKSIDISGIQQYPIGQPHYPTAVPFTGKFDGAGYTISGLALKDTSSQGFGLFGVIGGGFDGSDDAAVIKNLTVSGTVDGYRFVGALVGLILGNVEITNCATTADTAVTATGRTSGGMIGGAAFNITRSNAANAPYDYTVGYPYTVTIKDCTNAASISNTHSGSGDAAGARTGGVIGQINTSTVSGGSILVENCTNSGAVTGTQNDVGGVVGYLELFTGDAAMLGCSNTGTITGAAHIGGVLGWGRSGNDKATIPNAIIRVEKGFNSGAIVANGYCGGVIGEIDTHVSSSAEAYITACVNIGKVSSSNTTNSRAGGVVGYLYCNGGQTSVMEHCVNAGEVSGSVYVGGVTALINGGKVIDCINAGALSRTTAKNVGGITGWVTTGAGAVIQGCLNMGAVKGAEMANQIIGYKQGSATVSGCTYMVGTSGTVDNGATSVTAAKAKETLMDWCLTYGLNADSEEPANSDHYFVGTSTTCAICGAQAHSKHASSITMVERVVIEETCVDTGSKFMVCPTCLIRGEETEIPANPDKHVIGWNENGDYGCTREGCDYVKYAAADYTAVYVSAGGDDKADGTTAATAVASFKQAMDIAARSDNDVTVYLIGKVSPTARQINSTYNTFTNSFEEMPHSNTITITSAAGQNGELHFTDAARRYFLYGPTTFENVKISCAVTSGVYLFARGFEITMGEGLTMVDSKADDPSTTDVVEGKIRESKTDAAVAGLGLTTYTSDIKLYVYGGFYKETDSKTGATKTGSYAGADMETYNANISVLSGEFWTVCAFNRGFGETQNMENATATITVGDVVAAYVIGTTTDGADMNNVVVNMHYTAPAQIAHGYRFAYSANSAGSGNTMNHYFYADAEGLKFGDFSVGSKLSGVDVNTYYAVALTDNPTVLALLAKDARYPAYRTGTVTFTTLSEYCLDTLGGHTFVSDVCSFCGVKKCDNTTKGHTYVWDTETGTAICVGDCTSTLNVNNYSAVYVSDNGRVGAAGTKADPFGSFRQAIDVAAAANKDMTVYLVGTVTLKARQYSGENTYAYAFEEAPHDNKITVASESTNNKGTLKFTSSCYMYYLYGETVFQNIKIAAQRTGGNYFFGRGFKLTMDNGLTMVDINGKTETVKNNDTIAKFGTTVKTSDIKLYVFGGFLLNGNTNGLYEGMTTDDIAGISTDVTVLSGSYWTIGGGSRGASSIARDGMNVKMTIGAVTSAYIIPLTSDGCVINNTTVNMHFTGKFNAALVYRFAFDGVSTGSGNVINNFYYKGARDAKVGDMPVGSANCPTEINLYYANSIDASSAILEGIRQKNSIYAQTYQQIGEEMCFSEWCVERGGGHTWNSNGVCTFCEITECMHVNTAWSVVSEANCVTTGVEANRCTVCFEHIEEREIPVDATAHKLVWVYGADAYVATCQNAGCTYTVTKAYPTVSEVHVSASGSADGDGSENNPLNDFGAAMAIAAAQDTDVTVYIHDMAIIPDSGHAELNVYLEPAHADNKITVTSYGDTRATLRFNSNTPRGYTILYALSGPTTFENIELSSWDTQSRFYMAARHYPLVLGEGITVDYQRGTDQSVAGSDMIIIGGCYGTKTLPDGGCENKDVNLTVLSGSYGAIIGGAYLNGTCCVDEYTVMHDNGTPDNANDDYTTTHSGGDIHLTLGGDLVVRRQLYMGNYGDSTRYGSNNNIHIDIVGNISVGSTFGFGPAGVYYTDAGKTQSAPYTAKNVYLNLYDGFISGGSFYGTNDALKPFVLGAVVDGGSPVDRIAGKLYISVDVTNRYANAAFKDLLAALGAHDVPGDKWEATIWDEGYCTVNGGDHTPMGDAIDSAAATCTAEGYVVYVCSGCGEEYVEVLEREAHVYDGSTSIAATCIAPAMEKQLCTVCNAPQYTVTGSEFGAHTEPVGGFCQLCNADLSVDCDHVNASTEAVVVGCGTGTKWYCPDCDKTVVDLPAAEHNYGKYVVTVEPTETQTGLKTRTCKGCGKVDTAILYATDAVNASVVATTENGEVAYDVVASKLSKSEKVALNALLQESAYGAEVKVSYETNGSGALNVTYNIPVPAAYTDYTDVRIAVKDDEGKIHFVDFKIEKGYIVFTF